MKNDSYHIWHPYTQMQTAEAPILIAKGKGVELYDEKGDAYIDAISSWWVNLHGHSNEVIGKAIQEQLKKLEHVIFAGFTHQSAIELSQSLLKILPENQSKIFFSDNGSTAVEAALKMAVQYGKNLGKKESTIAALEGGYHGDTFGAMSVGARSLFTDPFREYLFDTTFISAPNKKNKDDIFQKFEKIAEDDQMGVFIFEPIVQGVAGMNMYEPEYLDTLISICQKNNVITIADEVMTGFGRLGKNFASDFLSNKPDIICLSKGITGGFLPLGVTSVTEQIYGQFLSNDSSRTFFHGHSYTANPLSCAAAIASIELLQKKETRENINMISESHRKFAESIQNIQAVKNVHHKGTILSIEIENTRETSYTNPIGKKLYRYYISEKILLRPLGNIIYIMPPYCITSKQLGRVYEVIKESLHMIEKNEL